MLLKVTTMLLEGVFLGHFSTVLIRKPHNKKVERI